MTTFDPMASILEMLPPELALPLKALGEIIGPIAEEVRRGAITPEDAGKKIGYAMIPTFRALREGSAAGRI